MTPDKLAHETDSAVEQLLLKKNGERKTVQDVFEVVVAMHHDRRADTLRLLSEIQSNRAVLEQHLTQDVRMTNAEFKQFMESRDEKLDAIEADIQSDLDKIRTHCAELHTREPRRKTDPETEDWGNSYGEKTRRQVWLMWLLSTAIGKVLVFVAGGAAMIGIDRLFGN